MQIQSRVREFIAENFLFGQIGELADDESLLEAGIIDSTGVLELVSFLESAFGISVDDEDLVPANLDSVERVVAFTRRKLREQEARIAG